MITYYSYMEDNRHLPKEKATRIQTSSNRSKGGLQMKLFRFMLVAVVISLIFASGALVNAYAVSASSVSHIDKEALTYQAVQFNPTVFVRQGDTLWTIAKAHISEGGNIRSYIAKIKKLNHIENSMIFEGQRLILPANP